MLNARGIYDKCRRLQNRHRHIEQRWQDVRSARRGDLDAVFPDLVSEDWPKPIIANFVDTVARDLTEILAPLPAFNCTSATMRSDEARRFADKRSKIAQHYIANSRVDVQMQFGGDHYFTYGQSVIYIEPDFDDKIPRLVFEEPIGGYPEYDRWGRITSYTKRFIGDAEDMAVRYPEYDDQIRQAAKEMAVSGGSQVELVRYCDKDQIALVLMSQQPVTLTSVDNKLGEVPVAIAQRPWLDQREPKGQFDDVIWLQMARDILAKLQLEATEKAVQAPLALPHDVQEITSGPDAILRTATPDKIRRVGLELSPAAFTESQFLLEEMRQGTRYPSARTGGVQGSIVTGRGVEALMGGFDTQIKAAQNAFRFAFVDAIRLCFMMDEKLWPNREKEIRVQVNGSPYEVKYKPARDIAGDYTCDVSYGFAAGLDPNRAVVMLLQLRAEKAISRDLFMRQLPIDMNITEEQTKVQVEDTREAIMQGVYAYVQAIPAMAQQGVDPAEAVQKLAQIVAGLRKGKAIEDVVSAAFAPQLQLDSNGQPQAPPQQQPQPPGMGPETAPGGPAGPGGPGAPMAGGLTAQGLMRGVSPGQAGMAPGGRPDLQTMLAGLTGAGQPSMSSFVMRRRRA